MNLFLITIVALILLATIFYFTYRSFNQVKEEPEVPFHPLRYPAPKVSNESFPKLNHWNQPFIGPPPPQPEKRKAIASVSNAVITPTPITEQHDPLDTEAPLYIETHDILRITDPFLEDKSSAASHTYELPKDVEPTYADSFTRDPSNEVPFGGGHSGGAGAGRSFESPTPVVDWCGTTSSVYDVRDTGHNCDNSSSSYDSSSSTDSSSGFSND